MGENQNGMDRRTILQMAGLSVGSALLTHCASGSKKEDDGFFIDDKQQVFKIGPVAADDGPIDRTLGDLSPFQFSGDDSDHAHQILWNVPRFIQSLGGAIPEPTERVPVVIIGGGVSGLLTGYHLKKYSPVLLESAGRFGGHSRGESWRGLDYSLGASSVAAPAPGSSLDGLFKELDLYRSLKEVPMNESVLLKGSLGTNYFSASSDGILSAQWKALQGYFENVKESKNGLIFPALPPVTPQQISFVKDLDRLTFRDHLRRVLGVESLHVSIDVWFEHYCWGHFGVSFREVNAAVALNHVATKSGKTLAAPGGNALIAEHLLKRLKATLGEDRLRVRSVVFEVKVHGDEVWVTYERDGKVKTIAAESVVFACPKYVLRKTFANLEPSRDKSIRRLRYNSYLVANVLLNQKLVRNFYEADIMGDGRLDPKKFQQSVEEDRAIKAVNGTFVNLDAKLGILTLHRPFPYLSGLSQVYSTGAYLKYRKEFIAQVESEVLPALKIPTSAVAGIRMVRWGHALPVAYPGFINGGDMETLHRPFEEKIYFINQDNWLNPSFETAYSESLRWTPELIKALELRRSRRTNSVKPAVTTPEKKGE